MNGSAADSAPGVKSAATPVSPTPVQFMTLDSIVPYLSSTVAGNAREMAPGTEMLQAVNTDFSATSEAPETLDFLTVGEDTEPGEESNLFQIPAQPVKMLKSFFNENTDLFSELNIPVAFMPEKADMFKSDLELILDEMAGA